jgi:hypothetical protein
LAAEEPTISTESRRAPEGMSKPVCVPGVSGEARAEAMGHYSNTIHYCSVTRRNFGV